MFHGLQAGIQLSTQIETLSVNHSNFPSNYTLQHQGIAIVGGKGKGGGVTYSPNGIPHSLIPSIQTIMSLQSSSSPSVKGVISVGGGVGYQTLVPGIVQAGASGAASRQGS